MKASNVFAQRIIVTRTAKSVVEIQHLSHPSGVKYVLVTETVDYVKISTISERQKSVGQMTIGAI